MPPRPARWKDSSSRAPIDFRLYVITDRHACGENRLRQVIEDAAAAGVRAFQLREKDLAPVEQFRLARHLQETVQPHGADLIINDRADIAQAVNAAGVHLTAVSLPVPAVRVVVGAEALIGRSTHSVEEVKRARQEGADYALFGPVFETPSKAGFGPPHGVFELKAAVETAAGMPVFAVGGVTPDRVSDILATGAHGVAVIRAILAAEDVGAAVKNFERALGGL